MAARAFANSPIRHGAMLRHITQGAAVQASLQILYQFHTTRGASRPRPYAAMRADGWRASILRTAMLPFAHSLTAGRAIFNRCTTACAEGTTGSDMPTPGSTHLDAKDQSPFFFIHSSYGYRWRVDLSFNPDITNMDHHRDSPSTTASSTYI